MSGKRRTPELEIFPDLDELTDSDYRRLAESQYWTAFDIVSTILNKSIWKDGRSYTDTFVRYPDVLFALRIVQNATDRGELTPTEPDPWPVRVQERDQGTILKGGEQYELAVALSWLKTRKLVSSQTLVALNVDDAGYRTKRVRWGTGTPEERLWRRLAMLDIYWFWDDLRVGNRLNMTRILEHMTFPEGLDPELTFQGKLRLYFENLFGEQGAAKFESVQAFIHNSGGKPRKAHPRRQRDNLTQFIRWLYPIKDWGARASSSKAHEK